MTDVIDSTLCWIRPDISDPKVCVISTVENQGTAVLQHNGYITWTLTINPIGMSPLTEDQHVHVTQTSQSAVGTLTTALLGTTPTTTVTVTSAIGSPHFDTTAPLVFNSVSLPVQSITSGAVVAGSLTAGAAYFSKAPQVGHQLKIGHAPSQTTCSAIGVFAVTSVHTKKIVSITSGVVISAAFATAPQVGDVLQVENAGAMDCPHVHRVFTVTVAFSPTRFTLDVGMTDVIDGTLCVFTTGYTLDAAMPNVVDGSVCVISTHSTIAASNIIDATPVTTPHAMGTLATALVGALTDHVIVTSPIGTTPFDATTNLVIGTYASQKTLQLYATQGVVFMDVSEPFTTVLKDNVTRVTSVVTVPHAVGVLKTSLAVDTTSMVILCASGVVFDTSAAITIVDGAAEGGTPKAVVVARGALSNPIHSGATTALVIRSDLGQAFDTSTPLVFGTSTSTTATTAVTAATTATSASSTTTTTQGITVVVGTTADSAIGTAAAVDLTYVPENGSRGTPLHSFFLAKGVGTPGSSATTFDYYVDTLIDNPNTPRRITVTRSIPDRQRGFTWSVTFLATPTLYNPPNMNIDVSAMSGYKPRGVVQTVMAGAAPLAGFFRMMFRGKNYFWDGKATGLDTAVGGDRYTSLTSPLIPWNATSLVMKHALEQMGAVEQVEVTRSTMTKTGGFTWTVTFKTNTGGRAGWDATRYQTSYGLKLDNVGNLQPMEVDMTRLAGTERKVLVSYLYNTSTSPIWNSKKIGFHGESAGAVYMYRQKGRRYEEEFKIRGQYTDSYDKFGHDTALWRHTLAVGAPHAEYRGYHEVQSVVCSADAGAFTLSFLDHTTAPIPFNSNALELKKMLEQLQSIVEVDIEIWQNAKELTHAQPTASICTVWAVDDPQARVVLITFRAPDRGNVPPMEADVDHRTGILHPEQSNLVGWATLRKGSAYGTVVVRDDVVQGTDAMHGTNAVGMNTGVVYIFRRSRLNEESPWEWHEEVRLQPTTVPFATEAPLHSNGIKGGAQYGYSVALVGPAIVDVNDRLSELAGTYTLVVGAPEDDVAGDGAGMVYVYRSQLKCLNPCRAGVCCTREWPLIQKISVRDMICGLSPSTKTAVPFKCHLDPQFGILPPHRFGHSVSITTDAGTLAIGELYDRSSMKRNKKKNVSARVPMQDSKAYVLRLTTNTKADGSVDLYTYIPDQILTTWDRPEYAPDGDEGYDDFGACVSVEKDVLLVGSPGAFDIATGTLRSGAAYCYKRLDSSHAFEPELKMQPPQVVYNQRFGRGVRVSTTSVAYQALITAHEEYLGEEGPRREVQEVTVFRTSANTLGSGQQTPVFRDMSSATTTTISGMWYLKYQNIQSIYPDTNMHGDTLDILAVGQRINAMHSATSEREYYSGTVLVVNPDGTYAVQFTDGHHEESLARNYIRRVDREKRNSPDRRVSEEYFTSRPLAPDITAANLRLSLMEDLGTGNVQITRSLPDRSGGYTWTIQFLEKDGKNVPAFIGVGKDLIGTGTGVRVTTTSIPTMHLKGGAYIWTRNIDAPAHAKLPIAGTVYGPHWYEQAVLFPEAAQSADMFGMRGLALSGAIAVVGAHNRDAFTSRLNSGAAFAFDLNFLNLRFDQLEYSASENVGYLNITIHRCAKDGQCIHGDEATSLPFNYVTGDGIATGLPPVRVEPTTFTHAEGVCTSRGNGCKSTASGKKECHVGSLYMNDCLFVKSNARTTELSRYDLRALSDYAPEVVPIMLLR